MSASSLAGASPDKKMTEQKKANENTPLSENMQMLYDGYDTTSHATFKKPAGEASEYLIDYQPLKLSTFRVFCLQRGTILKDPILLVEQILITTIFLSCAAPVYYYFRMHVDNPSSHIQSRTVKDVSLRRFIDEQEGKMRAFAMIMTTLAAFLLSFYTSIAVGRWWLMRTGGVGGIKAATVDLELLLYQNVTTEPEILSAVRRYGRASLTLIFLWRRGLLANHDEFRKELVSRGLLTDAEVDQLLKENWNHCLHETIWAWQSAIVTILYKEGKIKSDQLFQMLLEKCTEGRAAVQLVHTHLAVRVPMQYVHLLGLLVKMHNLVLAVIMGLLFGAAVREGDTIICIQLFGRTLILPFLFNAILLINAELSDPFRQGESDFPGIIYQDTLEKDCSKMIEATKNLPDWLQKRFPSEP